MTIKRRIERLENKHLSNHPRYAFLLGDGETEEEAKQRYCAENEVSMNELEEACLIIRLVALTASGDVKEGNE